MPPAIVAAAIAIGATAAATAGYIAITTALYITIAATVAGALLTKTNIPAIGNYTSQSERKQVLRAAVAPQVLVYGRTVVSGLLFFAEEQAGEQDIGEWIHLAIALCGHQIEKVDRIWLGEELVTEFPNSIVTYELHNNRTTPDPFMLANCPSWKTDMVGRGLAWLRISLKYDQDKFPAGIPNVKAEIYGKRVYDPRDGAVKWSDNAALCIRDYYSTVLGVPNSDLDDASFIAGANICDEDVRAGDATQKRYTVNGAIDASDACAGVLDDMHLACGGEPTYFAGKHGILVGAYYGPATMVIDEGQIVGDVKITPETSYNDKVNIVGGTFVDAAQDFVEADFPPVVIQEWVDEDGNEFQQDVKYRFVVSEFHAQRLAQITLARKRLGRTVELNLNMFGYRYRPGYYVFLNISVLGIVNHEFRVTDWKLNTTGGITVTLREETSQVWLDAVGKPIDRPDLTTLPTSQVPAPYDLAYEVLKIGDVVQGELTWKNAGQIAYNNVIIRQNGETVYTVQVPGQSVRLNGLVRGTYTAAVVAVSVMGAKSPESYLEFNIQAPNKPTGCEVQNGYFAITLIPRSADISEVGMTYDFWTSGETRLASTATEFVEANANHEGQGRQWNDNNLLNDHTYYWYIRAVNAFGASEFLEVPALVTADNAALLDIINENIQKTEAFANLNQSADDLWAAVIENALTHEGIVTRQYKEVTALGVKLSASITEVSTVVAENDRAYAEKFTQLNASVSGLQGSVSDISATVQQTSSAYADLNGKLSAQWGIKLQLNTATGSRYVAGVQLGLEANGGTVQSLFLVSANTFGVYNPTNNGQALAFAIQNGQMFVNEAFIPYASITLAKLGSWYSANYVAGQSGTIMRADGSFEFNGSDGGGRMTISNNVINVYDGNGVRRVAVGKVS